jgi:hypothetical protein
MEHYIKIEIQHVWSGTTVTDVNIDINFTNALSNNDYFDIDTSGYTPKAGDKIYFMPGVNVPRVKLKDLKQKLIFLISPIFRICVRYENFKYD